jgi:NitT/TauT family transport system ATP-binding protein
MVTHSIREAVLLADRVLVMTGYPGEITTTVDVPLPRPRHLAMEELPEFVHCVSVVRDAIAAHNA